MDVSIPKGLEAFVREQVESGLYDSQSEVYRDGLRLLKERKDQHAIKLEELKKQIVLGVAQLDNGEGVLLEVDDIVRLGKEHRNQL